MIKPDSYPRPEHLLGVYRPLLRSEWVLPVEEAADSFQEVLELRPAARMVVHLFSERELGRAAIHSKRQAMRVRKQIKSELAGTTFNSEITVATRGITAVSMNRRHLIGKLEPDDRLLVERQRIADIIPWEGDPPEVDDFLFQLSMGKLYDRSRKLEVVRALDPLFPEGITLAGGKAPAV